MSFPEDPLDTAGNPRSDPQLPPNFRHWNRDHVKIFLQVNKNEYGLDDDDIDQIYKSKIRGRHLPKLTTDELVERYKLPPGTAVSTQELITALIKPPPAPPKKLQPFSSYKSIKDVIEILIKRGQGDVDHIKNIIQFNPVPYSITDEDEELLHCLKEIHHRLLNMGSVVGDNEAVRSEFISSILHACLRIARKVTAKDITLYPQLAITGSESTGRVDYAIKAFQELLCITEGKQSDITAGFVQNIVQCDCAVQENARKRKLQDENNYVYGIITTATEWYFTVITPTEIFCTSQEPLTIRLNVSALVKDSQQQKTLHQEVKTVMETIVGLLKERAEIVQEPASKQKRWRGGVSA